MAVFGLGMTKGIEGMVASCDKCIKHQSNQPKEPMQFRDIPIFTIMAKSCIRCQKISAILLLFTTVIQSILKLHERNQASPSTGNSEKS